MYPKNASEIYMQKLRTCVERFFHIQFLYHYYTLAVGK